MRSRSFFRQPVAVCLALIVAGFYTVAGAQAPPVNSPQPSPQLLSPQQLDDLVAPLALYPDPLLSQVLVASTYPLELVEAQQWLQRNSGLSGAGLMDAARQQNWDPSVQALVAFPNVLTELNQDVRWTTDLGNAFLSQQADVMSAVQRMRASARANGKLNSSAEQVVTTDAQDGQSAIEIEPANPEVIYVPTYDPAYIWGPPVWGYYPPLLYPDFGFGFWPGFNVGLCFGGWGWGGVGGWAGWGWEPNWFGNGIFVNYGFFHNYGFRGGYSAGLRGRGVWTHNPSHRLGVSYPTRQLSQRYQAASRAGAARMGSRFMSSRSLGGNRGTFQGRSGSAGQFGGRSAMPRSGNSRSFSSPGVNRGYQTAPRFQSRGSSPNAPRYAAPSGRSPSFGGGTRSFGGAARSFGGGARSFSGGARSFGGGGARSFGGGAARSFGGGGGARSFGGGGARSFGGGGARSSGGGGHSGGGHGGRR